MAPRFGQKIKMLVLKEILEQYSDEEHPLNAEELCAQLGARGITAERKAIYDDVEQLREYGLDIIKTRTPKAGYFLGERQFELPEIYLLADAVRSAPFITPRKTRQLVQKLDGMLSVHQAAKREKNVFFDPAAKCDNESVFRMIDTVSQAIEARKKIKFSYRVRQLTDDRRIVPQETERVVSPYAMLWQDDRYYLIANYEKYDNLMHLRLDRMHGVELTEEPARPFCEVSPYKEQFDVADYAKKLFGMHGGTPTPVTLRCERRLLEQVLDRFGENLAVRHVTETHFECTVEVAVSDGLVRWLLGYGAAVTVLSPAALQDAVAAQAREILAVYGGAR